MYGTIARALLTIGFVSVVFSYSSFAYFTDTDLADQNTLAAGTLELALDGGDSLQDTFDTSAMVPTTTANAHGAQIALTGVDSSSSAVLDILVSLSNAVDDTSATDADEGGDSTAAPLATWIQIDTFSIGGTDLVPVDDFGTLDVDESDPNENGWFDLADLAASGTFAANAFDVTGTTFDLGYHLNENAPNHVKGDSVDTTVSFLLRQPGAAALV